MNFTEEQELILSQKRGSFKVLAAAGSGKTSTMSFLVKDEIDSGRANESEICFITFTRFAADQIKRKISTIMKRHTQVMYGTFHATMYRLLYKAGIEPPEPEGLYDARMEEGVKFFIELMTRREPKLVKILKTYKVLIVDEFQDLDEAQFDFVREFKEIQLELRVIAIGDLAQNIYRFRGTSNEFLRTYINDIVPGLKTFRLTTNFRSSKKILEFVNKIFKEEIKNKQILPMKDYSDSIVGQNIKYYEYAKCPGKGTGEYEELVATTLLSILTDAKKHGKSVCLIFPIMKCASFQIITGLLRKFSRESDYAFDFHQITKEDETCSTVEFSYNPKHSTAPVQASTIHGSKGLEWDIVALIDFSDKLYEIKGEEEDSEAFVSEKTNLAYVAITRAAEELYIFANANKMGRCRLFARLGAEIDNVMDCVYWGKEEVDPEGPGKRHMISVSDILKQIIQHPDLYERAKLCSEKIPIISQRGGNKLDKGNVYDEFKKRTREMAFGTYFDWKLKERMCDCKTKTLQQIMIELLTLEHFFTDKHASTETVQERLTKLDLSFTFAQKDPNEELIKYITASRYISKFFSRMIFMTPHVKALWYDIGNTIERIYRKETRTIKEEYILSQLTNFYMRGILSEIQAVSAPRELYQGLPNNFEEFIEYRIGPAQDLIKALIKTAGISEEVGIECDAPLESDTIIVGEADMIVGELLIEIKCGAHTKPVDLRESGSCKNLLQVLSYVALARHGTIQYDLKKAALINPLTGSWEMYDIEAWSMEDSKEFMDVLEELRSRV
jgi:hypothetical protein